MNYSLVKVVPTVAVAAMLLAACGGGGGGGETVAPVAVVAAPVAEVSQIPVSATTTAQSAFAFVNGIASTTDNTSDGLTVGDVGLATSDGDDADGSV